MDKKVSVIIPCYNQGKYVAYAINSALKQTYKNLEIVCVNDGSTDNSNEIIRTFADKNENILFLNNKENKGVIHARNTAIKACSGDYILPLDADDTIEPTYIEKAVNILDSNPNIGIVYCKARMFGNKNKYWDLSDFDKSDFLYANCIFCTALFRKTDFIKVGMYKDYMVFGCEDYDLWLSFIEQGFDVCRIDEILFNYRKYQENSRTTVYLKNKYQVWKILIKNHINLYLEDKQFLDKIFSNIYDVNKKYTKYKKIYKIFLPIIIMESLLLLFFAVIFCMVR